MGFASWQRYCTALQQWASTKLCGVEQRAPPIFTRWPSRWASAHIIVLIWVLFAVFSSAMAGREFNVVVPPLGTFCSLMFNYAIAFLHSNDILLSVYSLLRSPSVHLPVCMSGLHSTMQSCKQCVMAALRSRCGHYIFALWFLSSIFFSLSNLASQIGCLPYLHTWCGLSTNLRCRSETCWTALAANTWRKKSSKIAIWAPSHNFVGLYLRNEGTYRQSEKNSLSSNISQYGELRPLAAEIGPVVWRTPANFSWFCVLAALVHGTPVLGIGQTMRHWPEGATYIWQGGHHVGHWLTF